MLKLMIASDDSSQGVGEVFQAIVNQSRLSMTEFANRLQIINADLASCTNVSSLQNQRIPSNHAKEDLKNIFNILGGAHTLWNVGHAIYSKHYGENSDSQDLGAWRFLQGLGIPCPTAVDKKDYTLMIKNIEKIHKATLVYCIKVVMGTENQVVSEELPKLPSAKLAEYIQATFDRFFTPQAKKTAAETSLKLSNLILRLSDFATVVEGNAAMKGGNIGRLMNVWKRWAVISQGIKSLTQYSIHLPRMIILLTQVLKPGLARVILHSYLISPSGRQKHYLAKDQLLEMKNFWLKFLFNHSGRGTNIERLMNSYSVNITFLQNLIRNLASDCGKDNIFQSHHNKIDVISMNNCLRMCRQNDVCSANHTIDEFVPTAVKNFYSLGIKKLKAKFMEKGRPINKLRPLSMGVWDPNRGCNHLADTDTDVSTSGNEEPEADDDELGADSDDEGDSSDSSVEDN
ncbi:hypothetical protein PCASD_21343 [Puccinia coronata f. sp. avenae]|uniref:DUF6589 domain-containing protein n=1 Tax=Puccinia coronata f. sp. avenae TaxID=200324 RepID=A0A2N5TV64_9BASI|nr:hypothetical protein PCASD_21343 [Puccinia coronata f. sp. avenae]